MYTYPANKYLQSFFQGLLTENDYHLGHLNVSSHVKTEGIYGNIGIDNAFGFICGGDPSLEIWTDEQSKFQQVTVTPMQENIKISVNNVSNYSVNIASKDGNFIGQYNSTNGECVIPWPDSDCDIAINKHNFVPYILHVDRENYIQDAIIANDAYYFGTPLSIGYDVTSTQPYGNVVIQSGAKVHITLGSGVTIQNGFECENEAELVIE